MSKLCLAIVRQPLGCSAPVILTQNVFSMLHALHREHIIPKGSWQGPNTQLMCFAGCCSTVMNGHQPQCTCFLRESNLNVRVMLFRNVIAE